VVVQQKTLQFKSANKAALDFISDYDVKLEGDSLCFKESLFALEDNLKLSIRVNSRCLLSQ